MEGAFKQDFSNVEIHDNSSQAKKMGAKAFARGNQIHFAPGEYQPESNEGQELIGHELGHIVQNRKQQVKPTGLAADGSPMNNDPQLEQQADDMGRKAAQFRLKESMELPQKSPLSANNATPQAKMLVQMVPAIDGTHGQQEENGGQDGGTAGYDGYNPTNNTTGGQNNQSSNGSSASSSRSGGSSSSSRGGHQEKEGQEGENTTENNSQETKEGEGSGTDDTAANDGGTNGAGEGDTGANGGEENNSGGSKGRSGSQSGGSSSEGDTNEEGDSGSKGRSGGQEEESEAIDESLLDHKGSLGSVGTYLWETGKPALQQDLEGIQELANNEQRTTSANTKRIQSQNAVVPSAQEGQSKADEKRIAKTAKKAKPTLNKEKAKANFDQNLKKSLPTKLKEVDEFKENKQAKGISKSARDVLAIDKDKVVNTYGIMKERPAPESVSKHAIPLPDLEKAKTTPPLQLGEDAIAALPSDQLDFSNYQKEADAALEKEGLTQAHLDSINTGDLQIAKEQRSTLDKEINQAPDEIQELRQAKITELDTDMTAAEAQQRQQMKEQRHLGLVNAQAEQVKAKEGLEKEREQISSHINKIYENAQQKVTQKLTGLEQQAFQKFEQGQERAAEAFENNVDKRFKAFKKERYTTKSGDFDLIQWGKDLLINLSKIPEVQEILNEERERFVGEVNGLMETINQQNASVIQECQSIVADAKAEIEGYVHNLPANLQAIGETAQNNIQKELDDLETQIAAQEKALQEQLVAKKEEAIAAIDQAIEERKQKMSSLLSKYVNLLLNAALKYIETVLKIVGIDPDPVLEIIMKFKDAILTVVKDPISFFKDLGKAIGGGFKQFGQNAGQYLKETVLHWLGEKVGLVGIEFPKKFNLKGIIKLVASVLGVSWSGIKGMFGEFLGTDFVAKIESGVNFVKDLIADGPAHLKEWGEEKVKEKLTEKLGADKVQMIYLAIDFVKSIVQGGIGGMFDFIKEKAGEVKEMLLGQVDNIKTMVLGEIRNFILQKLINEGIKFLLSMLTPASGLAKAVELIFKVVQFFREQKDGLGALFTTIAQAIGLVFGGDVAGASSMIFKGILQAIPLLLDVIVNLLNLNNVFEKIKDVIAKVRGKVNDFIKSIVEWICKLLKGIWEKIKAWFAELKEKRKEKKAGKDNSENTPDYDDPEKKERVTKALDRIDTEQEQYTQDNKISKKDAKKVVKAVKASEEGKVFSKLKVIKGGDGKRWDYEWAASPTHVHTGKYAIENGELLDKYLKSSVGHGQENLEEDVRLVQELLLQRGSQLEVNGIWDVATAKAVEIFQCEVLQIMPEIITNNSFTWQILNDDACPDFPRNRAEIPILPVPPLQESQLKDIGINPKLIHFEFMDRGVLDGLRGGNSMYMLYYNGNPLGTIEIYLDSEKLTSFSSEHYAKAKEGNDYLQDYFDANVDFIVGLNESVAESEEQKILFGEIVYNGFANVSMLTLENLGKTAFAELLLGGNVSPSKVLGIKKGGKFPPYPSFKDKLRPPSDIHSVNTFKHNTQWGDGNRYTPKTVAKGHVNLKRDYQEIRSGKAIYDQKTHTFKTSTGRTYGFHHDKIAEGGTAAIYPIKGNVGEFVNITQAELKILKKMFSVGGLKGDAKKMFDGMAKSGNKGLSASSEKKLLDLFNSKK